jgi:hypothetical protein
MEPIEILGIASAALLLFAFVANEWGKLSSESLWYDLFNFLSALGLFAYAYHLGAVPFMVTNAVWGLVSGVDVARHFLKKHQ